MALVFADRVQDVTTTTGTGTITLANTPPTGFQSFAVIGNGNTTYYAIYGGNNWEVGIGTYTSIGTTLTRDTVLSSSNSNSLVNFGSGDKAVFVTYPAEKSVNEDATGNVNISITGNAATATKATNLNAGTAGAIPYQTASNTTSFVTAASGVLVGGTTPSFSTAPTLTGTNFTGIPNAALSNNTVTLGTTSVALGATSLTLAGLTSVTLTQDPVSNLQVATKQYVDTQVSTGIHYHQPVRVESPTNLTATYSNGTAGVGATLTNAGTQAALVIDGITLSVGNRVLIYTQTTQTQNGIYVVTSVGSGSTNWVLTRASDANTYVNASPTGLSQGSTVFVQEGATGAGETYTCTTVGTITFGTTAIVFAQISSAQIYSAGTGLTLSGTQFSLTSPVATTLGGTGLTTFGAANRAIYSSGTTTLTAGTLPTAAGGTGHTSYTDGQILIGKSLDGTFEKSTLTAGTSISITNGSGAITVTNTAPDRVVSLTGGGTTTIGGSYPNFSISSADQYVGTVTSVSASVGTTGTDVAVAVTNSTTTPAIALSIPTASALARGALTSTDWTAFNAKQTALVSGTNIKTINGSSILGSGDLSTLNTPLAVVGNATAGAEIRLPEDTDNGANYVALKAPNALAANLTLTLPTADGTSGQVLQTNGTGTLAFANVAVANGGTGATTLAANNVLLGNGTSALQVVAPGTTGNVLTSNGTTWTSSAAPSSAVQYPQNSRSADYTLVLGDAGKQIFHPASDNNIRTFTIPANSSVAFPVGTVIQFINMAEAIVRIAITTDTLTLSPGGTSGTLILLSNGSATCIKVTSTQWLISGSGLIAPPPVEYLVVAGGGGAGYAGGGAGGFRTGTLTPIVSGTTYTVTVGGGGAGGRNSGSNSVFATITSIGGGGGGAYSYSTRDGLSGGSGGGGGANTTDVGVGGAGTSGQGNAGGSGAVSYKGGGGGGAGAPGGNATGSTGGNGGAGLSSSLSGSSVFYGGGGGGYIGGTGGNGGGGNTGGIPGTANRGGGGGGRFGAGGSGIVILRYPNTFPNATVTGSPTLTNTGGYKIYTFTASGTITW